MKRFKLRVPTLVELQHKGEHFFHMSYLSFTYIEGHGLHAKAAGALLIVVIVGIFVRKEGKHEAPPTSQD